MEEQRYKKFLVQLKAVAEPTRLMLLNMIMSGIQCNCNLGDALRMKPNLISHHISVLQDAGLIMLERDVTDARWVYYSVNREEMEDFKQLLAEHFNCERIKPRIMQCGPLAPELFIDRIGVIGK